MNNDGKACQVLNYSSSTLTCSADHRMARFSFAEETENTTLSEINSADALIVSFNLLMHSHAQYIPISTHSQHVPTQTDH